VSVSVSASYSSCYNRCLLLQRSWTWWLIVFPTLYSFFVYCRIVFKTTQIFCGSLVVFLLSSYSTAMVPSWLSAVSFKCKGESGICVGIVMDKEWILTTASCLQKCSGDSLPHFKAFLNIPEKGKNRRVSLKSHSQVSVEDVWLHPNYDSITFGNNLALVKLKCHDINVKNNCSMPTECSSQSHSGYLHSSKQHLRSRVLSFEMDSEGNVTPSRCSIGLGMDTIYFCANQLIAVSCDKMNECVK